MYKDSKWAKEIIKLQGKDGSWGYFHTLSEPTKMPITTEQALRRLQILGYGYEDEPVRRAIEYLNDCLNGKRQIPDRREILHNWDIFTSLMFATWIRRFSKEYDKANEVANMWVNIISSSFVDGKYDEAENIKTYKEIFGSVPKGRRLIDFSNFYQVSLIADGLNIEIENAVVDYILNHDFGIYYIYDRTLLVPPEFNTKQASRYIAAFEILSAYRNSLHKFAFVLEWLKNNQNENGNWDMGNKAKDGIYFPLSDTWRQPQIRESDCTNRIMALFAALPMIIS